MCDVEFILELDQILFFTGTSSGQTNQASKFGNNARCFTASLAREVSGYMFDLPLRRRKGFVECGDDDRITLVLSGFLLVSTLACQTVRELFNRGSRTAECDKQYCQGSRHCVRSDPLISARTKKETARYLENRFKKLFRDVR